MKPRTCYIMIKDVPGQEEGVAALEWGIDLNFHEGEEMPDDIEELTEAQYAVWQMVQTLKGVFADAEIDDIRGEKGSGVVIPS